MDERGYGCLRLKERKTEFFILHDLLASERFCTRFGRYVCEAFVLFEESAIFIPATVVYEDGGSEVSDAVDRDDEGALEDDEATNDMDADEYMALALPGLM